MKKGIRKLLSITLAFAVAFTVIPAISGAFNVHAASKPAMVKEISYSRSGSTVTIKWKKLTKNLDGYTIYRNNKAIKSVGKGKSSYVNTGLKANKTYYYHVKAYKITKQKQWFNTKTRKWQKTKPAAQYLGSSRIADVKLYGKASPKVKVKTPKTLSSKLLNPGRIEYDKYEDTIYLTWGVAKGVSEIRVYKNGSKKPIATLKGTAKGYADKKLTWNKNGECNVKYVVEARKKTSSGTKTQKIKFSKNLKRAVTATATRGDDDEQVIKLTWDKVKNASKYRVSRTYTKDGNDYTVSFTVNGTSYTDNDIKPNVKYTYSVIAEANGSLIHATGLKVIK
ncbi:MAG: hypothetical protein IJH94_05010 [Clostridia bacterium]|nr:hypothetical protein [Mogibacterium sp.]MBR0366143.1 hypothetical protein [Clostridia bacterium]